MTFQLSRLRPYPADADRMTKFAVIFIILFSTQYKLIEPNPGFGIIKITLMVISTAMLLFSNFAMTKALLMGAVYLLYQVLQATFFPETLRWSTLLFSCGLMFMYINWYNMLYVKNVFSIDTFIKVLKWIMMAYFVFCIMQQACLLVGIHYFPLINLVRFLNRGIGCDSLSMEPSSFARTMLVCYYAYVKCCEYKRGEGPFTVKQLFTGEHRWVTIRFLWMMVSMGSATAFVCLMLFALYFVNKKNWMVAIPCVVVFFAVLQMIDFDPLQRATSTLQASSSLDANKVMETDGSAAARISPVLNSLNADFNDIKTWVGHGVDSSFNINIYSRTIFYEYGFIFYLIGLLFNIICAYRVRSLAFLFMLVGVGGGAGSNIWYAWDLMMVITGVRYFYDLYHPRKILLK